MTFLKLIHKQKGIMFAFFFCVVLAVLMPMQTASAKNVNVIQPTIDDISWDILVGVVKDDVGLLGTGNTKEIRRVGGENLLTLSTNTPAQTAELLKGINLGEPGKEASSSTSDYPVLFRFGTSDKQYNIERATIVKNSLVYELNRAYHFMYGEKASSLDNYRENMMKLLNNVSVGSGSGYTGALADKTMSTSDYVKLTNASGETDYFAYRIPKGYNKTPLSGKQLDEVSDLDEDNKDVAYITWDMLIYEAFVNYNFSDDLVVNSSNVYTDTPGTLEKGIVTLINSFIEFLIGALGLWNLDELVFNAGARGGASYIGGVFPASWESNLWTFFYIVLIIAITVLFFNILFNIFKRAQSTVNPFIRASAMEQIKNIFITIFALILLPLIFKILIGLSASLTDIFAATFGVDTSATDKFKSLSMQSGTLGGVVMQIAYLGAVLYFNFMYVLRSLIIVVLIILSPIFVTLYSTNEGGKAIATAWVKEFLANLFIQPLQALFLAVVLLMPGSGRNFENLILIYSLIPFTSLVKSLFFGNAGGLLHQVSGAGAGAAKGLLSSAGKATIGAGVGAVGAVLDGKGDKNKSHSGQSSNESSGEKSGEAATASATSNSNVASANNSMPTTVSSPAAEPTTSERATELSSKESFGEGSRGGETHGWKAAAQFSRAAASGAAGGAAKSLGYNDLGNRLEDHGANVAAKGWSNATGTPHKPKISSAVGESTSGNEQVGTFAEVNANHSDITAAYTVDDGNMNIAAPTNAQVDEINQQADQEYEEMLERARNDPDA